MKKIAVFGLLFGLFFSLSAVWAQNISLSFRRIELRDAFRMLARQAGFNLVVARGVKGVISVDLQNVDAVDAMSVLARGNGYQVIRQGNIYVVTQSKLSTGLGSIRVIKLRNNDSKNVAGILNNFKKNSGVSATYDKRSNSVILIEKR